jgi:hypothetical protein
MTAADRIYAYIKECRRTTRPELERQLSLSEKTVDSAVRKLERLGCIKRDGKAPAVQRQKRAVIFALADATVDADKVGDRRGRPRDGAPRPQPLSFVALNQVMGAFFGREAA